ncbi:hypothetical protein BH24CHL9_BH24CHL9_11110 [soil metagenome]
MTTYHQAPTAGPSRFARVLSEEENRHAVDLIEMAERETPHCLCGEAAAAVAHGDAVWLECTSLREPKGGLGGLLLRVSGGFGHTRRVIVDLAA